MNDRAASKICATCGRPFAWRKRWAGCWDEVRYCSEGCRRRRGSGTGQALESAILELLKLRRGTICPSEAARRVRKENWRDLMRATREAGRRLAAEEAIVVLQGGTAVDAATARGAVRYARGPRFHQAQRSAHQG